MNSLHIKILPASILLLLIFISSISPIPTTESESKVVYVPIDKLPRQSLQREASDNYVVINANGFEPSVIVIEAGESVTWHNATGITHTLQSGTPPDNAVYLPLVLNNSAGNQAEGANSEATSPSVSPARLSKPQQSDTLVAPLSPGADYTLAFDQSGTYDYYLDTATRFTSQVIVTEPENTIILRTSPANGEGEVAVTRESILEFNHPLDPASVSAAAIQAQFGGQALAATLHLSPDKKKVTLFYDQPLPASARVRLTIDGDQLQDETGNPIDADGDGSPGGTATIDFDTLGISLVPGTSVCGTVYASELGNDGNGNTVDVPLAGTTITVDGMESTLFTTTDANGEFCLDPAPTGRFFVHIDGRTATVGVPSGAYYPFVGKAWESIPGTQTDVGVVHLPLVQPGTLQAVSDSAETTIHFAQGVLDAYPDFAEVAITVPADSLFADDGTRGGQVGIAPVPPDRLPGTLPENLRFPVVITVQTDGATNFDVPAPVCFPNLPDPDTGEVLGPGEKSALMSFNHDTGRWGYVGPMTISDDGQLVCSDPGVGILAPGWHGSGPQPLSTEDDRPCGGAPQTNGAIDYRGMLSCFLERDGPQCEPEVYETCSEELVLDALGERSGWCERNRHRRFTSRQRPQRGETFYDYCSRRALDVSIEELTLCEKRYGTCPMKSAPNDLSTRYHQVFATQTDPIMDEIVAIHDQISDLLKPYGYGDTIPDTVQAQVDTLLAQANTVAGGSVDMYLSSKIQSNEAKIKTGIASLFTPDFPKTNLGNYEGNAPLYPIRYMAEVLRADNSILELRGWTGPLGQLTLSFPSDGQLLTILYYDPQTNTFGSIDEMLSVPPPVTLPQVMLLPITSDYLDTDSDKLPDMVEFVYATEPNNPDTDNDGIPDGAEVQQGTNPLDGMPVQTGIIASTDTPGTAVDVCALNDLAIVADSDAGLSVLRVNNGQSPLIVAQVDTPGQATRVTCANDVVAVADGSAGLAIVDISDPPAATISHQLALGEVKAVVASAGIVYAGLADGAVMAINLSDGAIIDAVNIGEAVLDLQLGQDVLYAYASADLYTLSLLDGMAVIDRDTSPGTYAADEIRPLRLFVGDDLAYAVHRTGYNSFDLSDPRNPSLITAGDTTQFGWRQLAANGSGLAVVTVGPNSTDDGPHHVSLYDVSDPTQTNQFLTEFATPGLATAVSIYNGLAYVADGTAGLQVINYLAYDALGQAPSITLTTNAVAGSIEEGQVLQLGASVADDVQVRNVNFYVDAESVSLDGNFPFVHRFMTPLLSQQASIELTAQATDTGGNITWASPINVTIEPDTTSPVATIVRPADGASLYDSESPVTVVSANFNEPIDPASLSSDSFQLYAAGSDSLIGTGDDVLVTNGTLSYQETLNMALLSFADPLPVDRYQAVITATVTDMAGNALVPFSWQFEVTSGAFGNWNLSRTIAFDRPQAAHYNPVDGRIYVGRRGSNSDGLYRIDPDGSTTQIAPGDNVAAVAVAPNSGHIFFSEDFDGVIYRVELTGTSRTTWVSGFHANDDDVVGMAFAPAVYTGSVVLPGHGLVVDRGSNGLDEVWQFSPDVPQGESVVHSDDGTLVDSVDIAIGTRDVYLVDDGDAADGVIYRLNLDGSLSPLSTTLALPAPQGITIDPQNGDLLVLDKVLDQIFRINPSIGLVSDELPGFALSFSAVGTPWAGVDISPDGQLLIVTDRGTNTIYVFVRTN